MTPSDPLEDFARDLVMADVTFRYSQTLVAQSEAVIRAWDKRNPEPDDLPGTPDPRSPHHPDAEPQPVSAWQNWQSRRLRMISSSKLAERQERESAHRQRYIDAVARLADLTCSSMGDLRTKAILALSIDSEDGTLSRAVVRDLVDLD
ncbi:MAG: hypothetical protein FWD68_01240 [Alphaproteobacteria bacterium]|nr:hypothetical protein [Alphaproteobacteria bacterium]